MRSRGWSAISGCLVGGGSARQCCAWRAGVDLLSSLAAGVLFLIASKQNGILECTHGRHGASGAFQSYRPVSAL